MDKRLKFKLVPLEYRRLLAFFEASQKTSAALFVRAGPPTERINRTGNGTEMDANSIPDIFIRKFNYLWRQSHGLIEP